MLRHNGHFRIHKIARIACVLVSVISLFIFSSPHAYADGTFPLYLSTKTAVIRDSGDYIVHSRLIRKGEDFHGYTSNKLKIAPAGPNVNLRFEVGTRTSDNDMAWYVYINDQTVEWDCLRGFKIASGCVQSGTDTLVGFDEWLQLELVTYGQGWWIARIRNNWDFTVSDVARIYVPSTSITYIFVETYVQEGYNNDPEDFLQTGIYWNWHPRYVKPTGWAEWDATSGPLLAEKNFIPHFFSPSYRCPQLYNVKQNIGGDNRSWYTGYANIQPGSCTVDPLF